MYSRLVGLLTLLVVVVCSCVDGFQIKDCTVGKPADAKLLSLTIDTCPDATGDVCEFIKGKNATMTIEFEPNTAFAEANIKIFAKMGPAKIPFHLPGPTNACGVYGINCPVRVGVRGHLKISLPVQTTYPSISTTVRFELNDEKKNPIICFEFPVKLKKANS